MPPAEFSVKRKSSELKKRSGYQEHFLDLCSLVDHGTPAALDPKREWFTFEYGAQKTDGANGFADVWKRGVFGLEYKGRHKDLGSAVFAPHRRPCTYTVKSS